MDLEHGCVACGATPEPQYRVERVVRFGAELETMYVCAEPECFTGFDEVIEALGDPLY